MSLQGCKKLGYLFVGPGHVLDWETKIVQNNVVIAFKLWCAKTMSKFCASPAAKIPLKMFTRNCLLQYFLLFFAFSSSSSSSSSFSTFSLRLREIHTGHVISEFFHGHETRTVTKNGRTGIRGDTGL